MRVIRQTKAISTLLVILLLLCSAILGGLISYVWVLSSYYNMPEDSTLLIVENVNFPIGNFSYFNLTVLNPSNSASDVNITAFRLTVEETNETYDVATIEYPSQLPALLARATRQTFKCIENWSNFAGDTVRIEPVANASTRSYPYVTPREELTITPSFDSIQTVEYFNLTVANSVDSTINLTISEITVFDQKIENVTPALPYVLPPNQNQVFRCNANWDSLRGINVTVTVKTAEGYESTYETNQLHGAVLSIDEVNFDYADTRHFNITVRNAQDSTEAVILSMVNLTMANVSAISLGTLPPLNIIPISVPPNQSLVVECAWDWSNQRNQAINVSVITKQGFTAPIITAVTPDAVIWNMTDVKFDLNDTNHFQVNVTNTPCSLNAINITRILLNGTETALDPPFAVIANDTQAMLNCTYDWTSLRGVNASVTVVAADGSNISRTISIPSVGLNLLEDHFVFGTLRDPVTNFTIPYFNLTVSNSINSLSDNVTITKIILEIGSETYEIDNDVTNPIVGQQGYSLSKGETMTFMCLFNWHRYLAPNPVEATVYTAEGFQASRTWQFQP